METKQICYLCGLPSDFLPYRGKAEGRVSCNRCGDYYIDALLVEGGGPTDKERKAILSGYTRWQKELGNPVPEINVENIEKIIEENKKYSDEEKIDRLLLYYSRKYPSKGSSANYDYNLDYSITYSQNSKEFLYLLKDVAYKKLGYLEVLAGGIFKIQPEGWQRIEWLEKIDLANAKYNIEKDKIVKKINSSELEMKEKAGLVNKRWSSVLAREIRDLYLQGTIEKLEKKLEIDKQIILGLQIVSNKEDFNFLSRRITELAEFEKIFLTERLNKIYQDCNVSQTKFDHDIAGIYIEVESKVKEILVDLKTEGLKKVKIPELPEIDIKSLIKKEESIQLEFKSTFQWDIKQNCINKDLRKEVIKTIAAFNNTKGGYLLIGIDDNKNIFGLEKDYSSFRGKQNQDVFLQTLTHEVENKISKDLAAKIDVRFYNLENKDICRIKVNFGSEPVWVKEDKDSEIFYIRLQNSIKDLSPSESFKHIKKRWEDF